jgi:hypothetical protein
MPSSPTDSLYRVLYDVKKINFRHTYGAYLFLHHKSL